jgi:hypothetical protein
MDSVRTWVPIEHRVGRVSQALEGHVEIVVVLQTALQGLPDDVGPAALEPLGGRVQRLDEFVGKPGR